MDAIRQVRVVHNNVITISVPDQLVNRTVEIILLPLNDQPEVQDAWPADFFQVTAGCMSEDPIFRAPQGDYEIRKDLL
jgi:hypothetical protein